MRIQRLLLVILVLSAISNLWKILDSYSSQTLQATIFFLVNALGTGHSAQSIQQGDQVCTAHYPRSYPDFLIDFSSELSNVSSGFFSFSPEVVWCLSCLLVSMTNHVIIVFTILHAMSSLLWLTLLITVNLKSQTALTLGVAACADTTLRRSPIHWLSNLLRTSILFYCTHVFSTVAVHSVQVPFLHVFRGHVT